MLVYPSSQSMFHENKSFNFQSQKQPTREDESTTTTATTTNMCNSTTNQGNSVGQQNITNVNLRDKLKTNLSLNNLEPRKNNVSVHMTTENKSTTAPSIVTTSPSSIKATTNISTNVSQPSTPTPTQILFPKYVTEEQEAYARGFAQALEELYKKQGVPALPAESNIPDEFVQRLVNQRSNVNEARISNYVPSVSNIQPIVHSNNSLSSVQSFTPHNSHYEPAFINLEPASTFNYQQLGRGLVDPSTSYWQSPTQFRNQTRIFSSSNYPHDSTFSSSCSSAIFQNVSIPAASTNCGIQPSMAIPIPFPKSEVVTNYADSPLGTTNSSYDSDDTLRAQSYTGPFTTLDMDEQEKLRLERKRAKNRIAAQKCQLRKVQRIQQLENKVDHLKQRNQILSERATNLRVEVDNLKRKINLHASKGCRLLSSNIFNPFEIMNS